jgi:hypothetical protein
LVNRGTDAEPIWEPEPFSFGFPAGEDLRRGPNEKTLITLINASYGEGGLLERVAKGPTERCRLTPR